MEVEIFFRNWPNAAICQLRYEKRIKELVQEMKKIHGDAYNPVFHDQIIKEISRGEIVCDHYEELIANDQEESPNVIFALRNERQQLNKNRDSLQHGTKGVASSKNNEETTVSKSSKDCLVNMLLLAVKDGNLKLDGDE